MVDTNGYSDIQIYPHTPMSNTPTSPPPALPRLWVHDPTRPHFLPPSVPHPTPLALIHDTLDLTRDYRDFVENIGKLELEYGRALAAAVRKFEARVDGIVVPVPGGRKPPPSSLVTALRSHLAQLSTVASLHQKRPGALTSQLVEPLTSIERHGAESERRLAGWAKDVRSRWDEGRERVERARSKYHASVKDHEGALQRFRQCPPPEGAHGAHGGSGTIVGAAAHSTLSSFSSSSRAESDWIKLERAAAEAERVREDRKRAYLIALAGEGVDGGGGRDASEGGGAEGWGEESRALYGHLHGSFLELVQHHAHEDAAHASLLVGVFTRAEEGYKAVSLLTDEDAFLDWNTSSSHASQMNGSSSSLSASSLSLTTPVEPSSSPFSLISATTSNPALACLSFEPPPSARDDAPVLGTERQIDRNWLVNRWLQSSSSLAEFEGKDGDGGVLGVKRKELEALRALCSTYGANRGLGDPDEVWERRVSLLHELGTEERKVAVARAEVHCVEAVLGPSPCPETPHDWKEKPYPTPSPCAACLQNVWSPLKPELSCRHCGIALHVKCSLNVDPECTGLNTSRRKSFSRGGGLRRTITTGARRLRRQSVYDAPHGAPQEYRPAQAQSGALSLEPLRDDELHVSPFVAATDTDRLAIVDALDTSPPPARGTFTLARVEHTYPADGTFELTVNRGEIVRVLEPDLDGQGWVKVRRGMDAGDEGLVPQSYLGVVGAATPPADGGVGAFVVALFDFPPPTHAPGIGETSVRQHAIYELSDEGMAFDDLWCELVVPDGTGVRLRGVVPKSYVTAV